MYVTRVILCSIICVLCPGAEMVHVQRVLERSAIRVLRTVGSALNHPLQSTVGTTSVTMERTVIRAGRTARNALPHLKSVATEPVVLGRTVERALGIAGLVHPQTPIVGICIVTHGKIVTRARRTAEHALSSCIAATVPALQKLERIAEHVTTTAGHAITLIQYVEMHRVNLERIVRRAPMTVGSAPLHLSPDAGMARVTAEKTVVSVQRTVGSVLLCVATEPVKLERIVGHVLGIAGNVLANHPQVLSQGVTRKLLQGHRQGLQACLLQPPLLLRELPP